MAAPLQTAPSAIDQTVFMGGFGLLILAVAYFFVLRRRGQGKQGLAMCAATALLVSAIWTATAGLDAATPFGFRLAYFVQGLPLSFGALAVFLAIGALATYLIGQLRRITQE